MKVILISTGLLLASVCTSTISAQDDRPQVTEELIQQWLQEQEEKKKKEEAEAAARATKQDEEATPEQRKDKAPRKAESRDRTSDDEPRLEIIIEELPQSDDSDEEEESPPVYRLPEGLTTSVSGEILSYLFDGYPITRLFFSNGEGDWNWALPLLPDFSLADSEPPFSIRFVNRLVPNVSVSYAFIPEDTFLPDLKKSSIQAYIRGLRERHGKALKLEPTVEPESEDEPPRIEANIDVPISGSMWWSIPYRIVDPEGKQQEVAVVDYLFTLEPYHVVVRHQGSPETVKSGTPALQKSLKRSYLLSEAPEKL